MSVGNCRLSHTPLKEQATRPHFLRLLPRELVALQGPLAPISGQRVVGRRGLASDPLHAPPDLLVSPSLQFTGA